MATFSTGDGVSFTGEIVEIHTEAGIEYARVKSPSPHHADTTVLIPTAWLDGLQPMGGAGDGGAGSQSGSDV